MTAGGVPEEKICDCVGDGESWSAFEPEEFAGGIEFEKNVSPVGCEDDVDGAVAQGEVIHKAPEFLFDLERKLIGSPILNHADAITTPTVTPRRASMGG